MNTSADLNGTSSWNETSACAAGVQSRKVSCVKMNASPVTSKRYAGSFEIIFFVQFNVSALYTVLHFSISFVDCVFPWFVLVFVPHKFCVHPNKCTHLFSLTDGFFPANYINECFLLSVHIPDIVKDNKNNFTKIKK